VTIGGCNFCDNRSFSPSRRLPRQSIREQMEEGIRRLKGKYPDCEKYLAYFQPASNTYAPVERLAKVYAEALDHPQVVGIAIGTRPDCLGNDVLELLADLQNRHYVALEIGMQSIHDRSLDWMNRGHHHDSFIDAVSRCRQFGLEVCAHVILGIPGESHADVMATARELARLEVEAVKIHNLYVVRKTPLAEQWERGELQLLERDDFIQLLIDFLEVLPPTTVVERISGDAPADYFLGPMWCLDKQALLTAFREEMKHRDTWQGKLWAN
jgi:radical SAM protein (TIGR01212 family)